MDEIRSLLKTIRGVGPNKPVTQLQLSEIIRALHRERMNLYDEYYTGGVKPIATGKNSVAIGEGAKSTSYREMLVGSFPEELTATPDEWVATDRMFGIGNGLDANNRHDAFRVYKSGYAQLNNGLRLGAYSWGANNPEAGALQYTAGGSLALYRNTTWNRLAFIDQFATNNQFSYFDSLTETLKTRAIAIADVTGLQTELDGKSPVHTHPYLSDSDSRISQWEAAYSARISSLTNVGNSGAATLVGNVLNIPNYTLAGLGAEPAFSKNTAFNKNFGTTAGTVLQGRTFGTAANSDVTDFAAASGSINYIQNQFSVNQIANIKIQGAISQIRTTSQGTPITIWGDDAGINNSYVALYNSPNSWRYSLGNNGTGIRKPIIFQYNDFGDDVTGIIAKFNIDGTTEFGGNITATTAKFTTGAAANTIFTGDATGLGSWKSLVDAGIAPASGSANYVQVSPAIAQSGNIWMNGYINATSYRLSGVDLFGSLTTGYLPYWDGSTLNNSVIYTDGNNIGLKTNLIKYPLTINTGINQNFQIRHHEYGSGSGVLVQFSNDADNSSVPAEFGASQFSFNVGNLGIGYTTGTELDNHKLAVNGNAFFSGFANATAYKLSGVDLYSSLAANTLQKWDGSKHVSVVNASGYLLNDGIGNMSFGAITGFLPTTGGELTGGLTGTTANFSGAATAASFVLGSTGWSIEVVSDKFTIKRNGVALKTLDASGNNKVLGDSYRGGL